MLSHFSIEISQFVKIFEPEVSKKSRLCREISKILDKSRKSQKSRFVSTILICLDALDKYLDKDKSRPKNLDFKNLDREKKKDYLDVMDIIDGFQKLVSTWRTISILIGLDCRDPHPYVFPKLTITQFEESHGLLQSLKFFDSLTNSRC